MKRERKPDEFVIPLDQRTGGDLVTPTWKHSYCSACREDIIWAEQPSGNVLPLTMSTARRRDSDSAWVAQEHALKCVDARRMKAELVVQDQRTEMRVK